MRVMCKSAITAGLLACLGLLLVPMSAMAQVSTGAVRGTVRDQTGSVLPGATIVVSGPTLMGAGSTDISNEKGIFQFNDLPSGLYTLTISLDGFTTVRRTGARVEVGRTIEQDVVLSVGGKTETVTVTSARPVVDLVHAGASTVFNQQLIDNVPTTRASYFDTITFAPAVKTDQSTNVAVFNVFGSNADQNSFQYDGVDISAPSFGSPWDFPNFAIMQEVQVRAIGASAEYYGFQGGVVNIITKAGSNRWKGTASYFGTGSALVGNNTPKEEFPFDIRYQHDGSLEVGGPIRKDRVWANGIIQAFRNRVSNVGVDRAFAPNQHKYRPFMKINAALSRRDSVEVLFNDNNFWSPDPLSRTAPAETVLVEHGHNPVIVGRWLRQIDHDSAIEVKAGGIYIRDRLDPLSGDLVTPGRYDFADGMSRANAGYTWKERENKTTFDAAYSRTTGRWIGGSHDLKTGVQYSYGSVTTNDAYLQNSFYYDFAGPYLLEKHDPSGTGGRVRTLGGFLQDNWSAGARWTLNLGARVDHTTADIPEIEQYDDTSTRGTGKKFAAVKDLAAFTNVSPRAGAVVRLNSSGRSVAKASYGRYYGKLNTNMFSVVSPGNTSFDGFEYNAATKKYDIPSYTVASGATARVDPRLKNQYTDQFSAGIEQQLGADFGVEVMVVHKRDHDIIRQRDASGVYTAVPLADTFGGKTTTLTVFNRTAASSSVYELTNRSDLSQSYNSVVAQAYKRWSGNWQLHASYVWQRAIGYASGDIGIRAQDPSAFSAASRNFARDPNDLINASGRLPTDSTHSVKLAATWQAPKGIQLATRFSLESGRPYGRVINALDLNQGVRPVLAEPRGAYEMAPVRDLQMRATKDLKCGTAGLLRLSIDVYNLFNVDAPLTVRNNSSEAGANFGQALSVFAPRRAMLGIRFEF